MRVRRHLALALFVLIAVAAVSPRLVSPPDRDQLRRAMTVYADRAWYPEYPAFLDSVRAATRPGDSIALVVPGMDWEHGYSYAYYRASYFLAGREVLPLITPAGERLPQNMARAKYVAAWEMRVSAPPWHPLLAAHGGVLLVR